jgi:DNA-directed RNA polymerase subunit RPC12/RpoP
MSLDGDTPMLTKTKLRALVPGKWARVRVPDYDCWKEPGTHVKPGDEVDVCVIPRYEPRYDYSNHFDWYYGVAYRRAGSDYFTKERKDGYFISTYDFGLISPLDPRFHANTEEHRAYHKGTGAHLYEPASDDPKLCPGGDYSCYQCSLCERYVEPFSNDDGELACPYCEVSGLVMFNPEDLDHLEEVRKFARGAGLSTQLERQLHYLASYGHRGNQCVLGRDFAPHSFSFAMYRPGVKDARKFIFNGGLIFQGPSQPADGSFPSLTVSLSSGTGWFCHT